MLEIWALPTIPLLLIHVKGFFMSNKSLPYKCNSFGISTTICDPLFNKKHLSVFYTWHCCIFDKQKKKKEHIIVQAPLFLTTSSKYLHACVSYSQSTNDTCTTECRLKAFINTYNSWSVKLHHFNSTFELVFRPTCLHTGSHSLQLKQT